MSEPMIGHGDVQNIMTIAMDFTPHLQHDDTKEPKVST